MSDDAPKKRSWFQIHLITAVVLMVVAGVLVWANVRPVSNRPIWTPVYEVENPFAGKGLKRGWPLAFQTYTESEVWGVQYVTLSKTTLGMNVVFALAILTAVAVSCGFLIRRRRT